jgi:hypothetical protein
MATKLNRTKINTMIVIAIGSPEQNERHAAADAVFNQIKAQGVAAQDALLEVFGQGSNEQLIAAMDEAQSLREEMEQKELDAEVSLAKVNGELRNAQNELLEAHTKYDALASEHAEEITKLVSERDEMLSRAAAYVESAVIRRERALRYAASPCNSCARREAFLIGSVLLTFEFVSAFEFKWSSVADWLWMMMLVSFGAICVFSAVYNLRWHRFWNQPPEKFVHKALFYLRGIFSFKDQDYDLQS